MVSIFWKYVNISGFYYCCLWSLFQYDYFFLKNYFIGIHFKFHQKGQCFLFFHCFLIYHVLQHMKLFASDILILFYDNFTVIYLIILCPSLYFTFIQKLYLYILTLLFLVTDFSAHTFCHLAIAIWLFKLCIKSCISIIIFIQMARSLLVSSLKLPDAVVWVFKDVAFGISFLRTLALLSLC